MFATFRFRGGAAPIAAIVAIAAALLSVLLPGVAEAQNPAAAITVDTSVNRKPINPQIYGIAHADAAMLNDLNVPLNRSGGNSTTRYNWQINADNRAFDWYFQSLPYGSSVAGEGGDTFVAASKAGGAQPMVTVPIIGWVAKLGPNRGRLSSFSIAKYGAQQDADWQWFPDAGNGVKTNGQNVVNDPNDASVLVDSTFQQGWVQHLVTRWGSAANGGVRYYILDNEHSIWHGTHRDVHPTGASMDEIKQKMIDYATKIKAADPGALVVGPEEWGWSGYLFSGLDQQTGAQNGWSFFPDRSSHGNMDYLPWLLDQMRQNHQSTGKRLLDVFTVHYYPQGGEYGNTTTTAMQLRRNRSTRSLWDPNYTDETWINDKVRLIPRLKQWVSTYYPGTPIGITEYNWGAEGHINGATALADVFGIFGREGLDMGAYWTYPGSTTPTYKAIKMYRNYDGAKSTFGDVSVSATGPNPDNVAVFAAQRTADNKVTVMVINKYLTGNTPATISLQGFNPRGPAQVWQLTSGNTINRLTDAAVTSRSVSLTLPPQSITLLVIPSSPEPSDFNADNHPDILWRNAAGTTYLWRMNGATLLSDSLVTTVDPSWKLDGIADFNGDGHPDIVWRNGAGETYVWYLVNGVFQSDAFLFSLPPQWVIQGVADFNADGKPDFLMRNTSSGNAFVWFFNNNVATGDQFLFNIDPVWKVEGVGDFNQDGQPDLLFRNMSSGLAFAWNTQFAAGTLSLGTSSPSIFGIDPVWEVVQVADWNNDGQRDLLFRNRNTGLVFVWYMNGTTLTTSGFITQIDPSWEIVPRR